MQAESRRATTEPDPPPPASPLCLGSRSADRLAGDLSLRARSTPYPQALCTCRYNPTQSEVLKFTLRRDTKGRSRTQPTPQPGFGTVLPTPRATYPGSSLSSPSPSSSTCGHSHSASQKGGCGVSGRTEAGVKGAGEEAPGHFGDRPPTPWHLSQCHKGQGIQHAARW